MDVYPCSWLARREMASEFRFDERYTRAPDWEFWLRVFEQPDRIVSVSTVMAGYRIHSSNDTFNPSTLRSMRDEEAVIIGRALERHPVSNPTARRAFAMIDTRDATRVFQMLARGRIRIAIRLVNDSVRARGLPAVARGWSRFFFRREMMAMPYDLALLLRRRVARSGRDDEIV